MVRENYLIHYGVLGMRWGVRRTKNSSGSFKKHFKDKKEYDNTKKYALNETKKAVKKSVKETGTLNRLQQKKIANNIIQKIGKKKYKQISKDKQYQESVRKFLKKNSLL